MNRFFGNFLDKFKFSDEQKEERIQSNQIATETDGAIEIENALNEYLLNLDWTYNTQAELIDTYREVSNYSVVDYAIDDIINEMVSFSEDEDPVTVDLSNLEDKLSENIRTKIYDGWEKVATILDLKETIHTRARQFYIDGRLSYQKVIDRKKPQDGILDVIELDSRFLTKIRNKEYDAESRTIASIEEYFLYDENVRTAANPKQKDTRMNVQFKEALRLNPDSIAYITSGLIDRKTGFTVGWLHKAVKPANQLRMMENALVIYRIVRAPERRIFYVDVANLPTKKAEQHIRSLKENYRNKMAFDPESGTLKDSRHLMTMQEDYWLPRNSAGRGTEVSTLSGGENLGQIEDIKYFQQELYKALNVPLTRLQPESSILGNRGAEISRDELKFSKFVSKIRKRFNALFMDLLKTELILTKVMTAKEWDEIKYYIEFRYAQDVYLEEMRRSEILRDRLDLRSQFEPLIGTYVSNGYVRREILKQRDVDIEEMDKEIEEEKKSNQYQQDDEGEM